MLGPVVVCVVFRCTPVCQGPSVVTVSDSTTPPYETRGAVAAGAANVTFRYESNHSFLLAS